MAGSAHQHHTLARASAGTYHARPPFRGAIIAMKALIQRVSSAAVRVEGNTVGEIGQGLLVLLGVERNDTVGRAEKLLDKVLRYRVFADDEGRMNRSVQDISGGILLVSQFTLAADTDKGLRPSFSSAGAPALARELSK